MLPISCKFIRPKESGKEEISSEPGTE